MLTLFINERGRLRSGWRAVIFLFTFLFLSFILILGAMGGTSLLVNGGSATGYLPLILPFAISAAIALLLGWLFGKIFEGLPYRALGLALTGSSLKNLLVGCGVGSVALVSAIIVAVMSGAMSITVNRSSSTSAITSTLLTTLLIFAVGALSEETLFRGYLLQTFSRAKLIWLGGAFTSLLFAFAHNNNPDVSNLSWLNTLIAGIWLAVAYYKTRDLWFPLGIHLMWNWLQGPIFGINVSGIAEFSPDPLLRATDSGPAWLTGGSYGIEGGLACTFALVVSIGIIHYLPGLKPTEEMLEMTSTEKPATTK